MLSLKEADVLIGARRVLDKITVISNLLKKKNCTILLGFNLFTDKCSFNSDSRWMEHIFLYEIKLMN